MAITIPSGVFDVYNEAVLLFTRTATLVYPEKREQCPNCYMNTMGTRNKSVSLDGTIQTIAYMSDLEKIEQCKYMIPKYDGIENYDRAKYEKNGPSFPQGFKQNATKYVVTFWGRIDA